MGYKSKEAAAEYKRQYSIRNAEKIKAREKIYREKNKEKLREWFQKYYLKNREQALAQRRVYLNNKTPEQKAIDKENRHKNYVANREKRLATNDERLLKTKYGLSKLDYDTINERQGKVCAICKNGQKHRLVVDHNHITGEVRGLLCRKCNMALGLVNDSPSILMSMTQYLKVIPK